MHHLTITFQFIFKNKMMNQFDFKLLKSFLKNRIQDFCS